MWQSFGFTGQWCSTSVHDRRASGIVPSSPSLAPPEKSILSFTAQVRVESGAVIVGTGGVLFTLIVTVRLSVRPPLSVTRRRARNVPGDVYVKDGFAVDTSSVPLPSKSHA